MSSSTNPNGSNPPQANLPKDDGVRIPGVTPQGSLPTVSNTRPQQQLLPTPGMHVPKQVLPPSSRNDPQENEIINPLIDPADLRLPHANILKIMKKALPADALIAKQAREDMERYVVEFIQFLTNEAAEDAAKTSRMVLYGRDILKAMDNTGFEHYAKALKPYLEAYKAQRHDGAVDPEAEDEGTSAAAAQRRRTPTPEPPQVTPS